jgi:cellulose synthase operon protein C
MEELVGRRQKAEELYRKALQIEPNYAPAANNLAFLMVERGEDLDSALSLAQIARQKMPDSASAADTSAWVYYHKGQYGFAADLLREALQKAPEKRNLSLSSRYGVRQVQEPGRRYKAFESCAADQSNSS